MAVEHKDIHAAINAVMQQVGYVQKDKRVGTGNYGYTYAGETALIDALRKPMVEAGIFPYVANVAEVYRDEVGTKNGTTQRTALIATIRFMHAPSGTFIDAMATGEGSDTLDKSSNKAMTGAYKYALRQTFCIETGDDPDDTLSPQPGGGSTSKASSSGQQQPPPPNWTQAAAAFMKAKNWKFVNIPALKAGEGDMQQKLLAWGNGRNDPFAEFKKLAEEAHKETADVG